MVFSITAFIPKVVIFALLLLVSFNVSAMNQLVETNKAARIASKTRIEKKGVTNDKCRRLIAREFDWPPWNGNYAIPPPSNPTRSCLTC
ncbi:hypothetical protein Csa_010805 [Cucumis sativus]|uniref:Uncharacterized protein n=1 Tax=Cucumis sativus TaxID=3659 RepID=A0A0A0L9E5_CUCSA|nr:hypothetical protein Csa_010805 [Cucumis sativus]